MVTSQYFCQSEEHRFFDLAEPIPGPATAAFQKRGEEARRGGDRVALRAACLGPVS
jgi:hypothetical protein